MAQPNKYLLQLGTSRKYPYDRYMASRNDMLLIVDGQQVEKPPFNPIQGQLVDPNNSQQITEMAIQQALRKMPKEELRALINGEAEGTTTELGFDFG